ncbi:MAG: hypothetical protein ACPG31_03690 [Planctomycetota bacterium]
MNVVIRIVAVVLAQGLGLAVATIAHGFLYRDGSLGAVLGEEYWSLMATVSFLGLVTVGLPALYFISLAGLQGRAMFMTFAGGLGATLFLAGVVLFSSPLEMPSLWMVSFALIHGCITGLAFALFMKALGDSGTIDDSLVEASELLS